MKRMATSLIIAALLLAPNLAAAQAPAQAPEKAPAATSAPPPAALPSAPQASPAPEHPKPGPGMACPMGQQMTPEQMKQMHQQCCAMMQQGQGCPMQKQLDELRQRVDALEGKKKSKKK